ncbi:tryptophan permease [Pectobacterium sp. B1J-3]|uniref:tryptophan permease n=1 Tax=Pectobacterium sp. B1J-3 TaxID=3385371 RepID=UPI003906BDF2
MSTATTTAPLSRPSILGGAMIISGTAVGAGMFSIPIVTAGVWFSGSVLLLIYTWACMLISGLMILETNLHYPAGASFHTMVKDLLGNVWSAINGISIAFVLYILTYAYISAGGSIITHTLEGYFNLGHSLFGFLFSLLVALIVWLSTRAVDRLSTILIGGMVITFALSVSDMFIQANNQILLNTQQQDQRYLPYALAALPYLLTSFGYHGNIPGLVKYYRKDAKAVVRSLLYGTLIALVIYLLWQYVIQGNIPRVAFITIAADGGNIDSLLKQMGSVAKTPYLIPLLNAFSYMALASSFLGVSLGLFDYISDYFKFADTTGGRTKAALVTFTPPTLAALIFPNGFIYAIGFAGLAATLWAVIVPALMVQKSRHRYTESCHVGEKPYRVPGGHAMVLFILAFGVINIIAHVLTLTHVLPVYTQ